jgi:DnaJ-domain-containing protein 1
MSLLYGLVALLGIWFVAKMFAGSNPALLAAYMKKGAGAASLALAAFLMMRGRIDMALFVGGFGAWLLGWAYSHPLAEWTRSWRVSQGKTSKVETPMILMELNHDSGDMRGQVKVGRFAGRALDALGPDDLKLLIEELRVGDGEGLRLLDAYLDRRFAGGRQHAEADADARSRRPPDGGAMSEKEAYDILGLQPGADAEAVRQAHRALIKRLHPDAGGSGALAAKVNEAKDVLLKRHG